MRNSGKCASFKKKEPFCFAPMCTSQQKLDTKTKNIYHLYQNSNM